MKANNKVVGVAPAKPKAVAVSAAPPQKPPTTQTQKKPPKKGPSGSGAPPAYFWWWLLLVILLLLVGLILIHSIMKPRAAFLPAPYYYAEEYPKILDNNVYVVQGSPDPHLETLEVREVEGGILVTWRWVIAPEPGTQYSLVARTWDQRIGGKEKPIVSVAVTSHQVLIPLDGRAISHAGIEVHYLDGMESGGNLPLNSKKY
jgi:hypothetical protein